MRAYTIVLKGCPRCGGDLFPDYEPAGWNLSCLQCGYIRWLEPLAAPGDEVTGTGPGLVVLAAEKERSAA